MMKTFQVLKDRPETDVVSGRNPVYAGDCRAAPHKKSVRVHSFTDPEALAQESSNGYLPQVAGFGYL